MHRDRVVKLWSTIQCVVVLGVLAVAPARASAGAATEILRPAVDRVLHILADPALQGAEHTTERRRALQGVMDGVIDFPDAARRALGVHWQGRTDAEHDEFISLFKELVTYSYIMTLEGYAGESVAFLSETESDGIVTVLTKLQSRHGPPVPIDYRMRQRAGRWLVYDVAVEGVSLVGNYRTQFNSIIRTTSYAELIHRMRTRINDLKAGAGRVALTLPLDATVFRGGLP